MKKTILLVFLLASIVGQAQTFDEWFRQKSTQLKYLKQQISALQAYIRVTENGYSIISEGTSAIAAIKTSDLALHNDYFASLGITKPAIRGSPIVEKIEEIKRWVGTISKEAATLSNNETFVSFFQQLLRESDQDIDWMKIVIGQATIQLTDVQRLEALNAIYDRMKQRLSNALQVMKMINQLKLNGIL